MNELTKLKYRILARIENYITDIELVEELTDDEKTIFASAKDIINKEFEQPIDEHKGLRAVEKQKLYDEAMKCAEAEQRRYENTIHFADAIIRLSQTCGISHSEAKDVIEESMEMLKKIQTNTDPTYISKLTQKAYEDGKRDGYVQANVSAISPDQIIKDTIKEYLDKPHDDVVELLLDLSHDLCERIKHEENS